MTLLELRGCLQLPYKLEWRGTGIPSGKVTRMGQATGGKLLWAPNN